MENLTYSWFIPSLTVIKLKDDLNNVIVTINWSRKVSDGNDFAYVNGSIGLASPDKDSFIPYENITKDQVVSWLEANVNVEEINAAALHELKQITTNQIETIAPPFGV